MTHRWQIISPLMHRELVFEEGQGIVTTQWVHRRTGTNYLPTLAHGHSEWNMEFSVQVDGQVLNSRSPHLRLLEHHQDSHTLSITLQAHDLQIQLNYEVFEAHPVLRKGIQFRNLSAQPIKINQLILESLELCVGHPDEQALFGFYGVQPRELFVSGRMEEPAIYQRNVKSGEGFVAMNEVPGILKRINTSWTWQSGIQLLYDTDIFPFERTLAPDETFATAKVSIAFTQENTEAAPQWVVPSYTSAILQRKGEHFQPPWIYNTWETFFRNIDETLLNELIPIAGKMGYDIFTVDDGWQAMMGSNDIRTSHFPNGLQPIRELVEGHGMRLGLWFALAVVDENAPILKEHPEWLCWDSTLKPRHTLTMSGNSPVMCLATPYREVVTAQIAEAVRLYHLAYIKLDLTTVFNTYGEGPGCYAQGHDHHSSAESFTRIYESIHQITQALYAEFPELLIDLTFELWGQKHIIDYGLLASGDLDWLSNVHDLSAAGTRQARTLLYHRSLAIPVDSMLIGNLQAHIHPIAERFATTIGSAPLLLGDLRQLNPSQVTWYREKIQWFKRLRKSFNIQHSFIPLGAWQQPNASQWDGFARLSREGEGVLVIFKNDSDEFEITVQLPLFTGKNYSLYSVMTDEALGIFSADKFRKGVKVKLQGTVEIIEVREYIAYL
jgi:alpha-galactosidase